MLDMLILAAVFGGTMLLVITAYQFVNRRRLSESEAVRQRLSGGMAAAAAMQQPAASILRDNRVSSLGFLNRLLTGRSFTASLTNEIERAGIKRSPGELVLITVALALVAWLLCARVHPLAGPVGAIVATLLVAVDLKRRQKGRLKKFELQLPEAIDMLVNAMKAGYSLQAAMKFVGEEMVDPLGPEFTRFYDEQRLGIDVRTALVHFQSRIESLDLKMFITSLLIQRESGGNLSEIMTNLSSLMRERVALRGEIDTLTAEPKMSAIVLTLLPIGMFAALNVMNRNYLMPLYTTGTGRTLLVYAVVSVIVGYVLLRRIGNIDI